MRIILGFTGVILVLTLIDVVGYDPTAWLIIIAIGFLVAIFFFVVGITLLHSGGSFSSYGFMNLILGKTEDPLSSRNKAGMIVRPNGRINFQSSRRK